MADIKITDLVDPAAIAELAKLDDQITSLYNTYAQVAKDMAKGLNIPVNNMDDLAKAQELLTKKSAEAAKVQGDLSKAIDQQRQVIADTTNTISRELMERERVNKLSREEYTETDKVKKLLEQLNGTYEERVNTMLKVSREIDSLKAKQKSLDKQYEMGRMSQQAYQEATAKNTIAQRALAAQKAQLTTQLKNEEREMQAIPGTYNHLSQQLELLKKAYKNMTDEEKSSDMGKEMETTIQNLDAHLKDMAADMGEFQRNVGNYAIAQSGLQKAFDEQVAAIAALEMQYGKLREAERSGAEGQKLAKDIEAVKKECKQTKAALDEQTKAMQKAKAEMGATSAPVQSVRQDLRNLVYEIATLTIQYRNMSAEEKASAEGVALKEHIDELTEKAGELKDAMSDTNDAIKNAASDTRTFDQIAKGVQLCIDSFGLATGAAHMLGLSEEDLVEVQAKLQAAIQASIALQNIQQAVQKQGALMQGITILQTKAAVVAENIKTVAVGKGVVATKAATVAQALFNKIAKANPYVLLAAAVISVVGALLAFSHGSAKAKKEEAERQKKLDESKEAQERFKQTVVESAGAQIAAYLKLKKQWEALGSSFTARNKWISDCKDKFRELGLKINDVNDAEKVFERYTQRMVRALVARATAEGYRKLMEDRAVQMAKDLEEAKTFSYRKVKAGTIMQGAQGTQMVYQPLTPEEREVAKGHISPTEAKYGGVYGEQIDQVGADIINEMRKEAGNRAGNERIQAIIQEGQADLDSMADSAVKMAASADKLSGGMLETGGNDSGSSSYSSGSSASNAASVPDAKNAEQINEYILNIKRESIKAQLELETEGSDEWLKLKMQSIDLEKEYELGQVGKKHDETLATLSDSLSQGMITQEQYDKQKQELEEQTQAHITAINGQALAEQTQAQQTALDRQAEAVEKHLQEVQAKYAASQSRLDKSYVNALAARKRQYASDLKACGNNEAAKAKVTEEYENDLAEMDERYAQQTLKNNIDMLSEMLKAENLSADERERIERELAKAKVDLENAAADAQIAAIKRVTKAEGDEAEKRKQKLMEYLQAAADTLNGINDLAQSIYDAKIERLEDEQDANDEAGEAEQERISELVEKKVITEEEGEARKRAAETKTAKKNEELEKKKQKLQQKQAIWDKANSIAQAGIATALAITRALPNLVLAAICGAMGALQVATILATPIPKYAKGTDYHKGGVAIVGDAGVAEVVVKDGNAWLTPDKPTLVDIPQGASVIPSVEQFNPDPQGLSKIGTKPDGKQSVIVNNDFRRLEEKMDNFIYEVKRQTQRQHRDAVDAQFENYKASRM